MRKIKNILLLLLTNLIFSSIQAQEKEFTVKIFQNGKSITIKKNTVKLQKKPFDIVFEMSEPMGILVNGSFDSTTFKNAKKGKPKSELLGFSNTGMAEGLLNKEKEIFISNDAPNYWHYKNKKNNRFNAISKIDGKIICTRTIEKIWEVENEKEILIENIKDKLYLVFIIYKMENYEEVEIQRHYIRIKWR